MRPTIAASVREEVSRDLYSSIQSSDSYGEKKPRVWIHDVTMGDFQLQNWRSIRRKQSLSTRNSNYVKVMSNTIVWLFMIWWIKF